MRTVVALGLLGVLCSCATGHSGATPASAVEVVAETPGMRPHKVVGTVRAPGSYSEADALRLLKERAVKCVFRSKATTVSDRKATTDSDGRRPPIPV
jgi:hypothetical protein